MSENVEAKVIDKTKSCRPST